MLCADRSAARACLKAATTDARNAGDGTSRAPAGFDELGGSLAEEGGTIAAFKDTGSSAGGLWGEASKSAARLLFVACVVGMTIKN